MKKLKKYLKSEKGAAQMIEAAIIYPMVFLVMFVLIYIGIFIVQTMTVASYAQKIALLASREIAYPGYLDLINDGNRDKIYSSAAVEADLGSNTSFDGIIKINFDPKKVQTKAYRYWSKHPLDKESEEAAAYASILQEMVNKNSIMGSKNQVTATIDSSNYFITQYVQVDVSQPLIEFGVLSFFGVKTPEVTSHVQASVNDTDEMVRNVDFVVDALSAVANKLGVDVSSVKEKVSKAAEWLG